MENRKITIIVISGLTLLIVVIGTLFFFQNKEMNTIINEMTMEKDYLTNEFRSLAFEYDSLQTDNDSLNFRLQIEQQKVNQLIEEIETVKATNAAKLRELNKQLGTMRKVMKHYVVQIDSLNTLNKALTAENVAVKKKYNEISRNISTLKAEKTKLTEKVERAAQLEATNITVETLNSNGRHTRRLSKTAKLKVCFTLEKNITAPTGEKPIYMCITDPNLETLTKESKNEFQYLNKNIPYSALRVIEYDGEQQDVCMYWDIDTFLYAGNYQIDLFADGNKIGSLEFTLD